jgi:hypothetical protein
MSDVKYRVFIKDWKTENEKNISGFVIISKIGPKKQATGEMFGFPSDRKIGPLQTEPSFSTTDEKLVEELIIIFYSKIIEEFQVDLTGRLSYELESSPTPSGLTPSGLTPSTLTDSKSSELKNIIFNVQKEGIFSNTKFGELRLIGESLVNENPGFDFGDEDDLSGLLLEDEFRESEFEGLSVEDMKLEEEKGENFGEETNYESGSVVDVKSDIAGKDKKTWEKTGTIVQGSKVPLDIAKAPSFNQKVTINKTIKTEYLDIINKIDTSYGTKLLAIVMAQKEGFEKGTRSYKTNNPGNIGNTDSGANKKLTTLKQGIELQISYINDVANGKHTSYPMGKRKEMKPFYSKEIANNPQYGMSPFLPGYSFIYTGKIEQYVKIYATGARAGNSYISMIVSWFRKNGYDWVNEETTIAELTKIQKITTSFSSNSVIKSTAKLEI